MGCRHLGSHGKVCDPCKFMLITLMGGFVMSDKIRVLYDDGGFTLPYGGVARYFTEMLKRFPDDIAWQFGMVNTGNIYLQKPPYNMPPPKQDVHDFIKNTLKGHSFRGVSYLYQMLARLMPKRFPSGELANKRALVQAFKKCDFDVLHVTAPHPVSDTWHPVVGKRPIVVTVYDLIPEIINRSKRVAKCRKKLLNDVTHIIAISEKTKIDMMRLYGVPEAKISVIHLGYLKQDGDASIDPPIPSPYILFVGRRDGYKNFQFFVEAIAPLLKTTDLMLFCTGGSFTAAEVTRFEKLGVADKVQQRFIEDEQMPSLFRNALTFVFPSIYEGFGLPILDAFSAGCPVILSNCSCFPEVGGDAALYFAEGDAETLRTHILNLMKDKALRQTLIEKGLKRAELFTWEKCSELTAKVYREVTHGIR